MARSQKPPPPPPQLLSWADAIGQALGIAVARGLTSGLVSAGVPLKRRPGRPPRPSLGPVAPEKRCKVAGCERPMRSKGLCSAHYQAKRRQAQANA